LLVGVFIKKRSCCAVSKAGTIPTVELEPCKYPDIELAVDDKVLSSK